MNRIATNKRTMYRAVATFGKEQAALLNALPIIPTTLAELKAVTDLIDQAAKQQTAKTSGITLTKTEQKKSMAQQAVIVAASISVLATKTNNLELKEKVNYATSTITRLTDAEAEVVCEIIHEQGSIYLSEASQYGLTKEALLHLQAAIAAFDALSGKRRGSHGTKVAATKDISRLLGQADDLLKEVLDKLMLPFKSSNTNLYNQYLHARQIIDLGSHHKPDDDGKDTEQ